MYSPLTKKLVTALCHLPGIGPKSAQRIAFKLLGERSRAAGLALAEALSQALTQVTRCELCQNYSEQSHCDICQNPRRNTTLLCVVESPMDVVAIEQMQHYHGRYFVLHGHLSPLDGIGPQELGIPNLLTLLQTIQIQEMIIATNSTMEGEATAHYLAQHAQRLKIICSRIAHGVPIGGELEYLDSHTLTHAFASRRNVTPVDTLLS